MAEWLREGGTGTPHYVVNPDHIQRLLNQGYQIVESNQTEHVLEPEDETEEGTEDDTGSRIAAISNASGTPKKSSSRRVDTTP